MEGISTTQAAQKRVMQDKIAWHLDGTRPHGLI